MKTSEIEIGYPPSIAFPNMQEHTLSEQEIGHPYFISGMRMGFIRILMFFTMAKIIISNYPNPLQWLKILRTLNHYHGLRLGESRINKMVKVDGKYYWRLYVPSWPSNAFNDFLEAEINRIYPCSHKTNRFSSIYLAVTNKCPLLCEHCYEWDALNKKDRLTLPELKTIVRKFQEQGTSQMHITGGEPLVRVNDILDILEIADKNTEFWVLTSGFNLTLENAKKLRSAGLTGVLISLDHFDPEIHNKFRGFKDSFQWVEKAVRNSIEANLVTALSICVTKTFVSESNLMKYMDLAKKMGVSFVQILEPRAVGHYQGQDVDLKPEHEKILESFYLKMNRDVGYKDYPIICYHGYHQRRMGCLAAGNRSLYVDTVGDLHACPFCQNKTGNALGENIDHSIEQLQSKGCHKFQGSGI